MFAVSQIPPQLREYPDWVVWRYEWIESRNEKTKVPYDARAVLRAVKEGLDPTITYLKAESNNPASWATFAEAVEAQQYGYDGVGFMLSPERNGIVGLDFDKCVYKGDIAVNVGAWLRRFDSYSEITPSQSGVRIFCRGKLPKGYRDGGIEIYSSRRFLTVTGNRISFTPTAIEDRQGCIDAFIAKHFPREKATAALASVNGKPALTSPASVAATSDPGQDAGILKRALAVPKFAKLYSGDWSDIPRKADGIEPDWSRAVSSFVGVLALFVRCPDAIDRIFIGSALYPQWSHKWDRLKDGMIVEALEYTEDRWEKDRLRNIPDASEATCEIEVGPEVNGQLPAAGPDPADADQGDKAASSPDPDQGDKPASPGAGEYRFEDYFAAHLQQDQQARPAIRVFKRSDIRKLPRPKYLVHDHIKERAFGLLYGPYGAFKSFYALDLSLSVANGLDFLGRFAVKPGRAVYCAGEGTAEIELRLSAWEKAKGIDITPDDRFALVPDAFGLTEDGNIEEAAKVISAHFGGQPVDIVVFDTVARYFGAGDENSTKDMNGFVNNAAALGKILGAAVLLVHHTGKDTTKGARGSVALGGACDYMIEVTGSAAQVKIRCEKQKDAAAFDTYFLTPEVIPLDSGADSLVLQYQGSAERIVADRQQDDKRRSFALVGLHLSTDPAEAVSIKDLLTRKATDHCEQWYRDTFHDARANGWLATDGKAKKGNPTRYYLTAEGEQMVNQYA